MIQISHVDKWYGGFQALKDCTTLIARGEVVVVCGPSGSGKSTLIKCVNALEPFQNGEIIIDGIKLKDRKTDLPKLRAKVGMVFQHFELFPHLRIDACETCHRYLVGVDLRRDATAVPVVDELAALPLDLYAKERGLSKVAPNLMGF